MVLRDIEREDIEFISKTLNCLPISHVDNMRPEKLGHADLVEEVQVGVTIVHADQPCCAGPVCVLPVLMLTIVCWSARPH